MAVKDREDLSTVRVGVIVEAELTVKATGILTVVKFVPLMTMLPV